MNCKTHDPKGDHPIHCCHTVITQSMPSIRHGYRLYWFMCVDCGIVSDTATMAKVR